VKIFLSETPEIYANLIYRLDGSGNITQICNGDSTERDSTGLYYFDARYYDPAVGRFITADTPPIGDLEDPQSLNRYVYCVNNPLKYTDPDGEIPYFIISGIAGAVVNTLWYAGKHPTFYQTEEGWKEITIAFGKGFVAGAIVGIMGPEAASTIGVETQLLTRGLAAIASATAEQGMRSVLDLETEPQNLAGVTEEWVIESIVGYKVSTTIGPYIEDQNLPGGKFTKALIEETISKTLTELGEYTMTGLTQSTYDYNAYMDELYWSQQSSDNYYNGSQ